MKTFLPIAAFAAMLGSLSVTSTASAITPGHPRVNEVNARSNNEQRRINNGVATGRLSPGQANRLERGQVHIQRQESRDLARHGGHLTWRDRMRLNREENAQSHRINRTEHHNVFHRMFGGH